MMQTLQLAAIGLVCSAMALSEDVVFTNWIPNGMSLKDTNFVEVLNKDGVLTRVIASVDAAGKVTYKEESTMLGTMSAKTATGVEGWGST